MDSRYPWYTTGSLESKSKTEKVLKAKRDRKDIKLLASKTTYTEANTPSPNHI